MYDIENRIVKINLHGEEFELLASTKATTKAGEYFTKSDLTEKNATVEAGYNTCLFVFLTLHNEALRFRAWQNKTEYRPKEIEEIEFMLVLDDLKIMANAISEAISKAKKTDVETETNLKN